MALGKKTGGRRKGSANKITATMQEMARPYAKKALKVVYKLLKDDSAAIRLQAGKELLDRGYGKAMQVTESKIDQTVKVDVTDTELARRAAFILAKADHVTKPETEEKHTTH